MDLGVEQTIFGGQTLDSIQVAMAAHWVIKTQWQYNYYTAYLT